MQPRAVGAVALWRDGQGVWHKHGDMASQSTSSRRPRPPLDEGKLRDLALHYVGRFATSRAKLVTYLRRKLKERGWSGRGEADPGALADRLTELGYIDDAAFAAAKARSLGARGYGARRVSSALYAAGIEDGDREGAMDAAEAGAVAAALRYAERKRIGPYALAEADPAARQKSLAAMLRAGHSFALARAILAMRPGAIPDPEELSTAR